MQGQAMENVVGWLRQDQLLLVQLQGGGDQIWRRQSYVSSEVRKPAGRMGEEAVRSSERDFPVFTILVPVNVRFAVISMKTHWNYFMANPERKWTQRMPLILSSCNTFRKKICNFENAFCDHLPGAVDILAMPRLEQPILANWWIWRQIGHKCYLQQSMKKM